MAIVRFKGHGETEVPVGTSLLEAAQKIHAPEGYACGGVCACSTCHVYVQKGAELLSEMEDDENDIATEVDLLTRLAQSQLQTALGDVRDTVVLAAQRAQRAPCLPYLVKTLRL